MRRRFVNFISPNMPKMVRSHSHSHSHGGCCSSSNSNGESNHHHHHHHQPLEATMRGKHLRQCQLVTIVGGFTNILFCVTKICAGSSGGSVALVADGFHALVDLLADVVSYTALTLSMKRLPRCHFPFGIGRIETAGAVIVAAILLFGGLALLFQSLQECKREAIHRFYQSDENNSNNNTNTLTNFHVKQQAGEFHNHQEHHHHHHDSHHGHSHFEVTQINEAGRVTIMWTMVWVSVLSIVSKEILFRWAKRVGERAGSRVVVANAYHHRADAWSGAVALVGVAGHCVGLPGIDGLAGICVSYSISRMGYSVLRNSVLEFFDFQNASEVAGVRKALQHYDKTHLVNVFLIRHGHSYALHVTLFVEANTKAIEMSTAAMELTSLAKNSVQVTDTFTTLFVYDKNDEISLQKALKLVEDFHGLAPISYNWEMKKLILLHLLQKECMDDVRTVASIFELNIVEYDDKSKQIVH